MQPRVAAAVPVALFAAFGVSACGTTTIDTGSAEKSIADNIQKQIGQRPQKVTCPDDIEAKKGGTFECKVTANGKTATVKAVQTDDDGHFNFTIAPS